MTHIWETIRNAYSGYASYLWHEITHPSWHNYFYWLIAVSFLFFLLEVIHPWRKKQAILRKDFWLDAFYMFFNFFLFSLIIYNAASDVVVVLLNDLVQGLTGFDLQASNPMAQWPLWSILLVGFIVRDFIQWWIHRLLHSSSRLWQFHKVHHSVQEMGFAAHLRFHWMETVVYRSLEYIPLALLGIGLYDFFIIHIFTLSWGHYNHANFSIGKKWVAAVVGLLIGIIVGQGLLDTHIDISWMGALTWAFPFFSALLFYFALGPWMQRLFNSPEMHIWHHSYDLPDTHPKGINFGLTLALWDFLFDTAYVPYDGRDIALGFPGVQNFPDDFIHQELYGLGKTK